jgi:hypothetical protein
MIPHIHRSKLRDAALSTRSSSPVDSTLQAHLAECPACTAIFNDERALLDAIDGAIETSVSEAPDPTWTRNVRTRLTEEAAVHRAAYRAWLPLAVGALALATGILIWTGIRYPFPSSENRAPLVSKATHLPGEPNRLGVKAAPSNTAESSRLNASASALPAAIARVPHRDSMHGARVSGSPAVRIDPEEWHSLVRFDTALNRNAIDPNALLASARLDEDSAIPADLQVEPIEIPSLQPESAPEAGGATR